MKEMNTEQALYVALSPERAQRYLKEAFEGTGSPRQAIRAKCIDCKKDNRIHIRFCDSFLCPLYLYRPFQIDHHFPPLPLKRKSNV